MAKTASFAPALGVIEVDAIARGLVVADAMVKRAEVRIVMADPVTPGKMVIVFVGGVAEVEESMEAGIEAAGEHERDRLFLPYVHEQLFEAVSRGADGERVEVPVIDEALGSLEFMTVSATLKAADHALKAAYVRLAALHLARGVGGKGYLVLAGEQHAIEASLDAGQYAVEDELCVARELIPRPHPDLDWVLTRL